MRIKKLSLFVHVTYDDDTAAEFTTDVTGEAFTGQLYDQSMIRRASESLLDAACEGMRRKCGLEADEAVKPVVAAQESIVTDESGSNPKSIRAKVSAPKR